MSEPSHPPRSAPPEPIGTSDQRTACRVDDWVPVALWSEADDPGDEQAEEGPRRSIEEVHATLNALRVQWQLDSDTATLPVMALAKLEWLMEMALLAVAQLDPAAVRLPISRAVNLSGSGIRCEASRPYPVGARIGVELILPPFQRIRAIGVVVDCQPLAPPRAGTQVAIQFVEMAADDRERLIRHVFRRQAEYLRARDGAA